MRLVIADDEVLLRQGLTRLLETTDVEVIASVGDASALKTAVSEYEPDAVIVDIKMPPTHTDEGITAALDIRQTPQRRRIGPVPLPRLPVCHEAAGAPRGVSGRERQVLADGPGALECGYLPTAGP